VDERHALPLRVRGHLDGVWSEWFDGLTITNPANGEAVLAGEVVDQAALHGLLQRLGSLGLPILEVRRVDRAPDRESDRPARVSCGPGATIQQDKIRGGDR
jgi:hypothetical protein